MRRTSAHGLLFWREAVACGVFPAEQYGTLDPFGLPHRQWSWWSPRHHLRHRHGYGFRVADQLGDGHAAGASSCSSYLPGLHLTPTTLGLTGRFYRDPVIPTIKLPAGPMRKPRGAADAFATQGRTSGRGIQAPTAHLFRHLPSLVAPSTVGADDPTNTHPHRGRAKRLPARA